MNQAELISGLKKQEESAFKILVEDYKDKVFNLCFGYVRNGSEAEDLAQEVFIDVFNSVGKFNEEAELSTWIYRITINTSLQFIRKQKAQKRWGFITSLFGNEDQVGRYYREEIHPGVTLENKERSKILFSKIDLLSENQKTAFLLNKIEGKDYKEVAEIMNTTVSSVESLLHRAKSNLRKSLESYYKQI